MAVKLVSLKCPECGATLQIEEGFYEHIFCSYCGTKIMIQNDNEHIYRHIDEAELKQAETERLIKLKKLEYLEKKREDAEKSKALKIKISLRMVIIGVIMMVIGFIAGGLTGDSDSSFYLIAFVGLYLIIGAAGIWAYSLKKEKKDNDIEDKV